MPGVQLATAFVTLRVNPDQVARDTTAGIEKGANAPAVTSAGEKAGSKTGKGFSSAFSSQLNKGLPQIAKDGEAAGQSWGSKFGGALGSVVRSTAKIGGVALVAGLVGSIKVASDFQQAMKRIQTQAGGTAQDVKILSADILGMRNVQQSPIQLAQAMYHLKSVGLDNVDAMKALTAASHLAAVGGADLEDTTNAIAGAWRSGIRGARNFGSAAATVNAIIGAGNMRLTDFNAALSTGILPSARTFGLGLGQVGAALALMTDEGIPAQNAATRLRMTFSLMGAPSAAAEKQLKSIGLTGLQLANAMRSPGGLISAIQLLKDHLDASGLSASQQAQVLSHAFGGGRSSSAILTLLNNLDVLKRKQDQINNSMGKFGPATVAQSKTAGAQFHMLGADFERIGIVVGTKVLPYVTKFIGWLATGNHLMPVLAVAVAGVTAALVTMAVAWAATPVGMITLGVAGLVAGLLILKAHWGAVWAFCKGVILGVWDWIKSHWPLLAVLLGGPFGALVVLVVKNFSKIKGAAQDLWHFVGPLFKFGIDIIEGLFLAWWFLVKKVFGFAVTVAKWAWGILTTLAKAYWAFQKPILQVFATVVTWLFKTILEPAAKWAWGRVTAIMTSAMSVGKTLIKAFWTVISTVFGWIIHGAASAFGWVPGLGGKLRDAAHQFDVFRDRVNAALGGVKNRKVDVGVSFSLGAQGHRLAGGGLVRGPGTETSDDIPAWLSDNEFVMQASAHRQYGTAAMAAINAGRASVAYRNGGPAGYANGGLVIHPELPSAAQISSNIGPTLRLLAQGLGAVGLPGGHGAIGGGVQRWAGLVLRVLAMLGQPAGDLGTVLAQMTTESGGNPYAINLTDSNAAAGDPSRGLMQTIMSTFLAYAGPFRGLGIYNPLANIFAGVNYAIHRYGAGWTSVLGHGHGYKLGGPVRAYDNPNGQWMPPGLSLSYNGTGGWEHLTPTKAGGGGPLIAFGDTYVQSPTDIELINQKLGYAITAAGLG